MKGTLLLFFSLISLSLFGSSSVNRSFYEFAMEIEGNYSPIKKIDKCPEISVNYSINDWNQSSYYGKEQIVITPLQSYNMGESGQAIYFFPNNYQAKKNRLRDSKVTDLRVLTKGVNTFKANKNGTFRLKQRLRILNHKESINCLYRKI